MPKMRFKKVTSSPLPGFWVIAQPEINILDWNFVPWLLVYGSILYIPFFYLEKCDFIGIYVWKSKFWFLIFWGSKNEYLSLPFCRAFNLASSSVFYLRFASKLYILEAIESWPFFDPKSCDMTSLKHHFLKKVPRFHWNFVCMCQLDAV